MAETTETGHNGHDGDLELFDMGPREIGGSGEEDILLMPAAEVQEEPDLTVVVLPP